MAIGDVPQSCRLDTGKRVIGQINGLEGKDVILGIEEIASIMWHGRTFPSGFAQKSPGWHK